jgi:2-polyprenyl-6-methoxyphenol hydroxylase-like FAD-dependent oxidoreductase
MTDVLIAGSGPTGLTLACDLAGRGAAVRIIDSRPGPHRESRGKTLAPRSFGVFERLGVLGRLRETGTTGITFRKYFDGAHIEDTPFEEALFIGQWQTEQVLREHLATLGVRVEYGTSLAGIAQDDSGVTAALADGSAIRARCLAGCDGGRSTTRRLLGIPFEGTSREEQAMVIGDVRAPGLARDAWHQWFTSDGGAMLLCPIPGPGGVFQLQSSPETDAEGRVLPPSLEGFQRLFDRHARMPGIRLAEPTWLSSWRVNVRRAARMREGRVFLAGDAAHAHPIAGGLGITAGVEDAAALGRVLAAALGRTGVPAGPGEDEGLDAYEAERLPAAEALLTDTTRRMERVVSAVREPGRGTETGLDGPSGPARRPQEAVGTASERERA